MPGTIADFAAAVENVISVSRDAEQGFRGAADAVGDSALKQRFVQLSTERGRYAEELQAAVRAMGFDATNPSGIGGTLHGGWMALKGLFTDHQPHAILEEAERGEDRSLRAYRQALAATLPVELRSLMERQFEQIQKDHLEIRTLRDQTAVHTEPAGPERPSSSPRV